MAFLRRLRGVNKTIFKRIQALLPEFVVITQNVVATSKERQVVERGKTLGMGSMPVDTGRLINSVQDFPSDINKRKLVYYIGSAVEYAIYVEEGTSRQQAQQPFRKGINLALSGIIDDMIHEIILDEIDEGFEEFFEEATE